MSQTVVIVEDNPLLARLYRAMLEPLPCRVLLAPSGEDALRLVRQEADPNDPAAAPPGPTEAGAMSGAGGDGARDPNGPPVFVAAARTAAERALQEMGRAGETIVVSKPIRGDELVSQVRRHLGRRR
jgi:CheY-like chemotaxis protein